ncbi:MAG: FtsX-like permease family protein, partial [Acidobacteria bacterium]
MNPADLLRFAVAALKGHRLRTGLSLVGMAVGVAAVIVLTALGEGARRYVTGQFSELGTNLVIVVPGKNETTGTVPFTAGVPHDLTLDDARAIVRQVPQVLRLAPISAATETVAFGPRRRQVAVFGTNRDYFRMRHLHMAYGEPLPAGDFERGAPVVVLGRKTARELFGERNPVGEVVRVGGWRMRVIGVMASKGVQIGVDLDDLALVPVATAMKMFDRSSLFRIVIEARGHHQLETIKQRVVALLTERHGEEDVTCLTQDAVLASFSSILGTLTVALAAIAAVSLSVAGLGIMNVMLVSVAERTAEVGLLKALGAGRRQILAVFLAEATLLSLAGGLLGLGSGWLGAKALVALFPALPAAPPAWAVAAALAVALGVGL